LVRDLDRVMTDDVQGFMEFAWLLVLVLAFAAVTVGHPPEPPSAPKRRTEWQDPFRWQ
jgi:hypothetical protein